MDGAELFDRILPPWRVIAADTVGVGYFDGFIRRNRRTLVELLDNALQARARRQAVETPASTPSALEAPPDEWTASRREKANLAAMQLLASKDDDALLTDDDRRVLLGYSGWGGLSIDKYLDKFPAGWDPDRFGLIHEYYTPSRVARAVADALCPYLPELAGRDGVLRALEPSAGIGRFILALNQVECEHAPIDWTAVELSTIAAKMLPHLFLDAEVFAGSFEEWLHRHTGRGGAQKGVETTARAQGKVRLVVANPPYGKRGPTAKWDEAPEYAEAEAFAYFLRRGLDLLAPRGIGVFLIPAGFMTGVGAGRRELRAKVLRRHHLMSAFRMPSVLFPGANLVTDLLFFRARGGELAEVDEGDRFIVDGDYFEQFPNYILGKEEGRGDDESERPRGRHQHRVVGDFEGLPPLVERPLCSACIVRPVNFAPATASRLVRRADTTDLAPLLAVAVSLGSRVTDYLAERAAGTPRAVELWPELLQSLRDFQAAPEVIAAGIENPWLWMELRRLAEQEMVGAQQFLNAFSKGGEISAAITTRPEVEERFAGEPSDLLGQVEYLYRSRRRPTIDDLLGFHQEQGGTTSRADALALLFRADWCVDGGAMRDLVPLRDYATGDLWPKIDRVDFYLGGDRRPADIPAEQLQRQKNRLLAAAGPVEFEDIDAVSPADGYIPLELVASWISETVNERYGAVALERLGGLVQVVDTGYADLKKAALDTETLWILGWLNHDNTFFAPNTLHHADPEADRVEAEAGLNELKVWDYRASYERAWKVSFAAWLREDAGRMEAVRDAYNRSFRRYVRREFSSEPIDIARWGGQVKLAPHQNAAVRRILEAHGGLLAFDVGVGKTYTGLGILAAARQEGWGRRPVVLVPSSLVWKWYRDFQRCLPDYRVAVIGSSRRQLSGGARVKEANRRLAADEIDKEQHRQLITVSGPDTPAERAAKWSAFQAGLYDAVILSYSALSQTAVDLDAIIAYAEQTPAIRRIVSLQERNEQSRKTKKKTAKKSKATERKKAVAEAGVKGFILDKLETDTRRGLDPGIRWENLGVDLLIVDEAQNFKNLYAPEPREGGIPKFMGLPAGGSKRAWQLDLRTSFVRQRTGGSGVVLLSATPAKNSPLEFYNILQYVDHDAFAKVGIHDPEEFIDRYLKIESRDVLDTNFDIVKKSAVVGFHRLDEIRAILDRYAEFRTAEEVGIKLPQPRVQRVDVEMDDVQEAKYDELVAAMTERLEALLKGEGGSSSAVLGDMVRMSLIAIHGQLDEGYDWSTAIEGGPATRTISETALARWMERGWTHVETNRDKETAKISRDLPRPDYNSPKFRAVAERIAAQPGCGHIIFCEPTATHKWIEEVLVEHGIPRERIAVMNAAATDTNARLQIADGFNGDEEAGVEPIYDVLIVNSVAYEGVDLQTRTCALHHVDLTWTPADLEQRNGRAYRQGNTLGTIEILYYIAQGSMDGYRFAVIHGKRGWLTSLLESQDRDTNNPAAQQDFSPEELLEYIARDKGKIRGLLAKRKEQKRQEEQQRQAANASVLLRQAVGRFRDARRLAAVDPERAAQLRKEAEERLTSLRRAPADVWPWAPWMEAFRQVDGLVPADGSAPVFEGMRVVQLRNNQETRAIEFGQVRDTKSGPVIGMRRAGEARWSLVGPLEIGALAIAPADLNAAAREWPDDDDTETAAALDQAIARMSSWKHIGWEGATDAFRATWWSRRGAALAEQLARRGDENERLPVEEDGDLLLKSGPALRDGTLLAPTAAGWERYLQLAPATGEPWAALRDVGDLWWGRRIPRDILARAPEVDDETALSRLRKQLARARELHDMPPREVATWFADNELDGAADLLDAYLDEPTRSFEDFSSELRLKLVDGLNKHFRTRAAHWHDGVPYVDEAVLHRDGERAYVLAQRVPDEPVRRVYVEEPVGYGAPYTVVDGELRKVDRIWETSEFGPDIEETWRRYARVLRALEMVPAFLGEAHDLIAVAAEAIESPKCQGDQRARAITALRTAERYYRKASNRVHMGRPARALEALQQFVRHLTTSAAAVAEACGVGQLDLVSGPIVISERDREALAAAGEDIVELADTAEGIDRAVLEVFGGKGATS